MRNVSDKTAGENRNTRLMFNDFFPKISYVGQATDENMAHARLHAE
jgi:hypothetical protein